MTASLALSSACFMPDWGKPAVSAVWQPAQVWGAAWAAAIERSKARSKTTWGRIAPGISRAFALRLPQQNCPERELGRKLHNTMTLLGCDGTKQCRVFVQVPWSWRLGRMVFSAIFSRRALALAGAVYYFDGAVVGAALVFPISGLVAVAGSCPKFCRITMDWSEKKVRLPSEPKLIGLALIT